MSPNNIKFNFFNYFYQKENKNICNIILEYLNCTFIKTK